MNTNTPAAIWQCDISNLMVDKGGILAIFFLRVRLERKIPCFGHIQVLKKICAHVAAIVTNWPRENFAHTLLARSIQHRSEFGHAFSRWAINSTTRQCFTDLGVRLVVLPNAEVYKGEALPLKVLHRMTPVTIKHQEMLIQADGRALARQAHLLDWTF